MYLIIKCEPLNDQYECDCYREPYCVIEDWKSKKFKLEYFEVYQIMPDGNLKCIKEWDDWE